MTSEPLLFIPCPFCGNHAASVYSHYVKNTAYVNGFGEFKRVQKYYTRCMVCNARGPLANSENLAREFWNNATYDDITRKQMFESLRYQK